MGLASKENSADVPNLPLKARGFNPSMHGSKPAAKSASLGQRTALAAKPINTMESAPLTKVGKSPRKRSPRRYAPQLDGLALTSWSGGAEAATGQRSLPLSAKRMRYAEDNHVSAPIAAQRKLSRSKALYPRPQWPSNGVYPDLGTVTSDKESAHSFLEDIVVDSNMERPRMRAPSLVAHLLPSIKRQMKLKLSDLPDIPLHSDSSGEEEPHTPSSSLLS